MALDSSKRARIILDLIKDGVVGNENPYNNLDLATAAIAKKYGDAFAAQYGKQWFTSDNPPIPRDPTNNELATFLVEKLKQHVKEIFKANKVRMQVDATQVTSAAAADAESLTDLGE